MRDLKPREQALLEILSRNAGTTIPRDVLLDAVWGVDRNVSDRTLDVHVSRLRAKCHGLKVTCLSKRGYRMEVL